MSNRLQVTMETRTSDFSTGIERESCFKFIPHVSLYFHAFKVNISQEEVMPKPYFCEECNKEFKYANGLWKHRKAYPTHRHEPDKSKSLRPKPANVATTEYLSEGNEGKKSFFLSNK